MTRKPQSGGKGRGQQKGQGQEKAERRSAGKKPAEAPTKVRTKAPAKTPKTKRPAPKKAPSRHWLVRPETIRRLWIGGLFALAGLVAVEAWVYTYGYFGIDGLFAFNAWFGFATCVAMILISNGLGILFKREDTYYDLD